MPSASKTGKAQEECPKTTPSTSQQRPSEHSTRSQNVRFNEGLLTGSTEMLHATNFYQNCVDHETESHWMEVYEEHKAGGQSSSSTNPTENGQENMSVSPKDSLLMARSTEVQHNYPLTTLSTSATLEKTHSADPRTVRKFETRLQRCNVMENIDKVADLG